MSRNGLVLFLFLAITLFSFGQGSMYTESMDSEMDSSVENEISLYIPYKTDTGTFLKAQRPSVTVQRIAMDEIYPEYAETGYCGRKSNKYGFFGIYGDTVVPFIADTIHLYYGAVIYSIGKEYHIKFPFSDNEQTFQADSIYMHDQLIYHYSNGRVGIATPNFVVPSEYKGITRLSCPVAKFWVNNQSSSSFTALFKVITSSNSLQLINEKNEQLLPPNVKEIQCFRDGYLLINDGYQKYYDIYSGDVIDNKGNDVVIYSNGVYKCYNQDRTRSKLTFNNQTFQNSYDDYFILDDDHLTVRKNGKVGVISIQSGRSLLPLKYEQVKRFKQSGPRYFKTYQDNYCGLTISGGKTLIPHRYSDLKSTTIPQLYLALKNNKGGIVSTEGKVVIPLEYDQISVNRKAILLRKGSYFGLFSPEGKEIIPLKYSNVATNYSFGAMSYIFYNDPSKLYIANHTGYIGEQPVSHVEFGDELIKTYKGNSIFVSVLDKDGRIEETQEYDNIESVKIGDRRSYSPQQRWRWRSDEFEENQLTGLFGRRALPDTGFTLQPAYNTLRFSLYGEPYGERNRSMHQMNLFGDINASNSRYYKNISTSNSNKPFLMQDDAYNATNTYSHNSFKSMIQDTLGRLSILSNINKYDSERYPPSSAVYSKYLSNGAKMHYFSNEKEIVNSLDKDISLVDYFNWLNILGVHKTSAKDLEKIFDPHLGVRFKDHTIMVSDDGLRINKDLNLNFHNPKYYADCKEYQNAGAFYYRKNKFGTIELFHKSPIVDDDAQPIIKNVMSVEKMVNRYTSDFLIRTSELNDFKIHRDYPNFLFKENEYFKSYDNGFLTLKVKDSNYVLLKPDHTILYDCLERIEHVSENYFMLKEIGEEGSFLIDVEQKDTLFEGVESITPVNSELSQVKLTRSGKPLYIYVDSDLKELWQASSPILHLNEDYIWIDQNKQIAMNLRTQRVDTLNYLDYDLFENGFIRYEYEGRNYVKIFGGTDSIKVRNDLNFIAFGSKLYGEYNDRFISITKELVEDKYDRNTNVDVLNSLFLVVNDGETTMIKDENENLIYSSENAEIEFNEAPNYVSFYENDTLKYLTNSGVITEDYSKAIIKRINNADYKITRTTKGFGLQIDNEIVLPNKYESVTVLNENEFIVSSRGFKKLYDSNLEYTGISGHEVHCIQMMDYYMIQNGPLEYVIQGNDILIDGMSYWGDDWLVNYNR